MVILFIWILLSVSLVIGCIKVHNTIIKGLFGILAGLCITVLCFVGIFYYLIVFKVSNVDTSVSSDGEYSLTMQAVGEPLFFGPADGQFILKKGEKRISKVKFSLRDDGGNISQDTWQVTWKKNQVEIIIYGEEQNDEQFLLFFDGKYKINELNTKYGKTLDELNEIAEEQTEEKTEQFLEKFLGEKAEKVIMGIVLVFSLAISIGLFMILPYIASEAAGKLIHNEYGILLMEGVIRIVIFLGYIVLISQMEDIKRVFMYHGAEHKTINCLEAGVPLTPENVDNFSRLHKRCGTSFIFIVMIISMVFFFFIRVDTIWLRIVLRLLFLPLVAGVSYEFIRLAGSSDHPLVQIFSKPGLALQKLTTKEPDHSMIEVAIASVEGVFDWREYLDSLNKGEQKEDE